MHLKLREHVSTQEAEKLRQGLCRDVIELREVLEKNILFGLSKPRRVGEYMPSQRTLPVNNVHFQYRCRSMLTALDASIDCWQVGRARGGALVQRNAYMLLYRRKSLGPPTLPVLPADLQADVDAKNKVGLTDKSHYYYACIYALNIAHSSYIVYRCST